MRSNHAVYGDMLCTSPLLLGFSVVQKQQQQQQLSGGRDDVVGHKVLIRLMNHVYLAASIILVLGLQVPLSTSVVAAAALHVGPPSDRRRRLLLLLYEA